MAKNQFDVIHNSMKHKNRMIVVGSIAELDRLTTLGSPVKTGDFRASWFFGINKEINEVASIGDRNPNDDNYQRLRSFKIGMTGYLTNARHYSIPLEFGLSKQAPNGMVRIYSAQWADINNKVSRALK